jgi:IS605 OrfB family transposase
LPDVPRGDVADAIGVDHGIVNVATTSDGGKYGGSTVLGLRRHFYHLRRKLQTKGTKSARRLLTKRSKRERRFMADVNHRLTKQIAQAAQCTSRVVGVENLQGIRARGQVRQEQRRTHSSWAFGQFTAFLAYKCADRGVPFVLVDPHDTSKTCSRCGHCEKANRHSQSSFLCRRCGFAAHADWSGAENIRQRAVALLGAGGAETPTTNTSGPTTARWRVILASSPTGYVHGSCRHDAAALVLI